VISPSGKIAVDRYESPSAVRTAEEVRLVIGQLVSRRREIDRVGVVRRDLDAPDIGEVRHRRRRDVLPGLAAVAGDVNEPVIGRGPDLPPPVRRRGERCAGRVHFRAGVLVRDVASGIPLAALIVEAEVRGNLLPAHALIAAAEYMVATRVQDRAVMRRKDNREGPGEAVSHVLGRDADRLIGPHIHQLDLPGAVVVALQCPGTPGAGADRAAIDNVGIFGIHGDKTALAGAGIGAVAERDRTPLGGARCRDRGVVLLRGIDAIGVLIVDVDAIELRRRLVVDRRPGLAAIDADAGAAVVTLDHPFGVGRIYPEIMIVAVRRLDFGRASAAVGRFPQRKVGDIDRLGMTGIGEDMRVVPGPMHQIAMRGNQRPAVAVILRSVEPGLLRFRLHERPNAARARRRYGNAELAEGARR
jgi:hypothetical protein